ncbi:MAG: hypothetical protein LBN97_06175 [Oscillospiraceae bacterium]|jgi:hypothetical protein|nr:hypothetical protein [Oscillospiraceae bacterium]
MNIENIDFRALPFGRRYTRLLIAQRGGALWLNYTGAKERPELIRLIPTRNGCAVRYSAVCNPGKLTLTEERGGGTLELVYGNGETLLIRGSGGLGLRFCIEFDAHEQFMDRLDGTVYAGFSMLGEFLFEAVSGVQTHNYRWIAIAMKPEPLELTWEPEAGGDIYGYIHHADYCVNRPAAPLGDFDAHAGANYSDYRQWRAKYPEDIESPISSPYETWIGCMFPKGYLKTDFIIGTGFRNPPAGDYVKVGGNGDTSMQCMYAAELWQDVDLAVKFLYTAFSLQDEYGQIPVDATAWGVEYSKPSFPMQGWALLQIIEKAGLSALTRTHAELLYEPFIRWIEWWFSFRPAEAEYLTSDILNDCILAASKLALVLGKTAEADKLQQKYDDNREKWVTK